jgi:hypothetical protein
MSDIALPAAGVGASSWEHPRAFDTIVYGGLAIGLLDGLFAFVFYGWILGAKPLRIFQSVAVGVLGRASFDGGTRTFLFGLLLHFIVATCIATVYFFAALKFPVLIRHAVAAGLIYGMIAYLGMNYLVIPLSRIGLRPFSFRLFLPAFLGHAVLVGLPVALIARWSARPRASRPHLSDQL